LCTRVRVFFLSTEKNAPKAYRGEGGLSPNLKGGLFLRLGGLWKISRASFHKVRFKPGFNVRR